MSQSIKDLRIFIAHGSDDVRETLADFASKRHVVLGTAGTVVQMKQAVIEERPDLLITGVKYPDGDGIDAAIELGHVAPLPTVVATSARSLELVEKAMRDHVMAYLIEPILSEDLQAAIIVAWARYLELTHLEAQVDDMKTALEDRKIIERAKGILMASESIGEAEAFSRLRTRSQDNREKMVDVARRVLDEAQEEAKQKS